MKKVIIHTDGSCEGNPGPGAWAAVLQYGPHVRELTGAEAATTNNRMELQAAISALEALRERCVVDLFTDSEYLRDGIISWIARWKLNGWRTVDRKPVKNGHLWRQLDAATAQHQVQWHWLKGHAGHSLNERCDQLARGEISRLRKLSTPEHMAAKLAEFNAQRTRDPNQSALFD